MARSLLIKIIHLAPNAIYLGTKPGTHARHAKSSTTFHMRRIIKIHQKNPLLICQSRWPQPASSMARLPIETRVTPLSHRRRFGVLLNLLRCVYLLASVSYPHDTSSTVQKMDKSFSNNSAPPSRSLGDARANTHDASHMSVPYIGKPPF